MASTSTAPPQLPSTATATSSGDISISVPEESAPSLGRMKSRLPIKARRTSDKNLTPKELQSYVQSVHCQFIFQVVLLLVISSVLSYTLSFKVVRDMVVCGLLISRFLVALIFLCVELNINMKFFYTYLLHKTRETVIFGMWFGVKEIVWCEGDVKIFFYLNKIWKCGGVGFLIRCLDCSSHVGKFFEHIQKMVFGEYVMEILLTKTLPPTDSPTNMKEMIKKVRKRLVLVTHDREIHITCEEEAKSLAEKIFVGVAEQDSRHIYMQDLVNFMPRETASKAMRLFGEHNNVGISKLALEIWVVATFKTRLTVALSIDETKRVIKKVDFILRIVAAGVILVIWSLILKITTKELLILLGSQNLLATFVFRNTCITVFECINLFMRHPFDVGDRVEIDGVQLEVQKISTLKTLFLKTDNTVVYTPNNILSTKSIHNFNRSPDMEESIDFSIPSSTPNEKVDEMKILLTWYVNNNSEYWHLSPRFAARNVEDSNMLKYTLWVKYKMNFQDMHERWTRRSLLLDKMIRLCRELGIQFLSKEITPLGGDP